MARSLRRDIRFLKAYALVTTTLLAGVGLVGFRAADQKTTFQEIDVERINVVEADGTRRLAISNKARLPEPVVGGKAFPLRSGAKRAGLLFYNDRGDESGGLIYGGDEKDGVRRASTSLLFDQFNQDETLALSYGESNNGRSAGLSVYDRPDAPILPFAEKAATIMQMPDGPEKTAALNKLRAEHPGATTRVFVGKSRDRAAVLLLCDLEGRPRVQLMVDATGAPKLEFLDEKGTVVHRLPEATTGSGAKKDNP